jgi:hypothetical protein
MSDGSWTQDGRNFTATHNGEPISVRWFLDEGFPCADLDSTHPLYDDLQQYIEDHADELTDWYREDFGLTNGGPDA